MTVGDGWILFDSVEATRCDGIAFDDWYDNEYRAALGRRWAGAPQSRYVSAARGCMVTILELDEAHRGRDATPANESASERIAGHERLVGRPLGSQRRPDAPDDLSSAPIAYPVFFAVPTAATAEFDRWYDEEHLPLLLGCGAWLACRRFDVDGVNPRGWTRMALHYLADASALRSPERDAARGTPWRDRLSANPWFRGDYRVLHRLR